MITSMESPGVYSVPCGAFYGRKQPLTSLLFDARTFMDSDPRNTIYAVLGLTCESYDIRPDYSEKKSIAEVMIDLAIRVNTHHGRLILLSWITLRKVEYLGPSCFPDWLSEPDGRLSKGHERSEQFALLEADQMGRKDVILPARGNFHGVLYKSDEDHAQRFHIVERAEESKEVIDWIYGGHVLYR